MMINCPLTEKERLFIKTKLKENSMVLGSLVHRLLMEFFMKGTEN